eukprot:537944-Pelagomonas_calceolata.AAC.2
MEWKDSADYCVDEFANAIIALDKNQHKPGRIKNATSIVRGAQNGQKQTKSRAEFCAQGRYAPEKKHVLSCFGAKLYT